LRLLAFLGATKKKNHNHYGFAKILVFIAQAPINLVLYQ